jgi:hypothetical protein
VFEKRVLRGLFSPKVEKIKEAGENYIIRSFAICTVSKCYLCDKIKEGQIDEACSAHGRDEKCK